MAQICAGCAALLIICAWNAKGANAGLLVRHVVGANVNVLRYSVTKASPLPIPILKLIQRGMKNGAKNACSLW